MSMERGDDWLQVMPGAQLETGVVFRDRETDEKISVIPVMVDFTRLLQSETAVDVVRGISNRDLMHAVVALHDVSLSDMTPDVLYSSVCNKWARTIVLLRDIDETVQEVESKRQKRLSTLELNSNSGEESTHTKNSAVDLRDSNDSKSRDCELEEDIYCPEEARPSTFSDVFSDTSDDEDDEDDDDDDNTNAVDKSGVADGCDEDEDFSKGIHSFLRGVRERQKQINCRKTPVTVDDVGINHRIIAATTFEKKFIAGNQKVVHLTLISVRRRHQKCGIGKYLIKLIKNPSIVGLSDATVVHADNSAVTFFKKNGFSDDVVLNKRWSEIAEQYTHCTLMCYLPMFTQSSNYSTAPELDLVAMETEITKWRSKSLDAYQAEMSCMLRMRQEIIHLRAFVGSQQDIIDNLTTKNEQLEFEAFRLRKDLLKYRLLASMSDLENLVQSTDDHLRGNSNSKYTINSDEDSDLEDILKELNVTQPAMSHHSNDPNDNVKLYVLQNNSDVEEMKPDDERMSELREIINDFSKSLSSTAGDYRIVSVTTADSLEKVRGTFSATVLETRSSSAIKRLYFNGDGLNVHQILRNGFSSEDVSEGRCGSGLYFSTHPKGLMSNLLSYKIIVAEVAIGNAKEIDNSESEMTVSPSDYDSVIVTGSGDFVEYAIYNVSFSCPLCLLEVNLLQK